MKTRIAAFAVLVLGANSLQAQLQFSITGMATTPVSFTSRAQWGTQDSVSIPATPAGIAATRWLAAINSGDSTKIAAYLGDTTLNVPWMSSRPLAERTSLMMSQHRTEGTLVPVQLGLTAGEKPNSIGVWFRSAKSGEERLFLFMVEDVSPYRMKIIGQVMDPR